MTPHSPLRRVPMPRALARGAATFVLAAIVVGAAPVATHALDDAPVRAPQLIIRDSGPVFDVPVDENTAERTPAPDETPEPDNETPTPNDNTPESESVDPAIVVLTDTYEWDEQSPRVEALQQTLGVTADGWYGHQTANAHRAALEFADLPVDTVPEPVLPPGPSAQAWAALRGCEAGGDYTITNPSGKYRGAYQFDRSTWDSVAGRNNPTLVGVDPAAAAPADQDAMALALWHERGSAPWPHCGRHLR